MWVSAEYQSTTLFTLKPATATASGGKTLPVPTPYAIKMALLDAACRLDGQASAAQHWDEWLGQTLVALRPAERLVVNNTFIKVLRPRRNPAAPGSQDAGYFGKTIAYREFAYLHDPLGIALEVAHDDQAALLSRWLLHINYLGKRGSFMQIVAPPQVAEMLPADHIVVDGQIGGFDLSGSLLLQLDDVGEAASFDRVSIYSSAKMTLGIHRVLRHVALPYRLVRSSRNYSYYERSAET